MRRAKRSLGQNFLVDGNVQRKIVAALDAGPEDEVVEIGPGRGALTQHLASSVGRLVAVELDDDLATDLATRYANAEHVEIVHGDVLRDPWLERVHDPAAVRIVGNIPYNITSPILFRLLERPRARLVVVMVQEEVADRVVSAPGSGSYGALSVGVQSVARVEKLFRVSRNAFRPVPGVDSAILRIEPRRPEPLDEQEERALRVLVRSVFQWRRKQLGKTLRDHPELKFEVAVADRVLELVGIGGTQRPEEIAPETFVKLVRALEGAKPSI